MRIISDVKLDYKDVLICPKRSTLSSRVDVDITRTFTFLNSKNEWTGIPIMASNMDTVGTFEMAAAICPKGLITCIDKSFTLEDWVKFEKSHPNILPNMAVSSGIKETHFAKLKEILKAVNPGFINLDVSNGYSQSFVEFVKKVREMYPNKTIIAGNVATMEMVEELLLSGADIVKIGIGPGSVCTTRVKTGVGYPQLSAVIECADAAHGLKGMIIADGGCNRTGDVCKALGAGADFVMLGGMLAAHDESGGASLDRGGVPHKEFYGMSSERAMRLHNGGVAEYKAAEGKETAIPSRGPVARTVGDLLGGLRSACTFVGAKSLRELSRRTTFVRVTMQENTVFGA